MLLSTQLYYIGPICICAHVYTCRIHIYTYIGHLHDLLAHSYRPMRIEPTLIGLYTIRAYIFVQLDGHPQVWTYR